MAREALLIIDMLRDFVEEGSPLGVSSARVIIPRIRERIRKTRERGMPIIYICDAHREGDEEFESWPKHAISGTRGSGVVDELKFLGTDLELLLRELKIERVNIVGILTNICVFFTAAEASMRGYRVTVYADSVAALSEKEVTVYADSVAALSEKEHKFALDQLKRVLKIEVLE